MKNYPELKCYKDVVFWWKFFLNTDRKVFPNYSDPENSRDIPRLDRMNAQLNFAWDDAQGAYEVTGLGISLKCRPDPRQVNPLTGKPIDPQHLPTHRFPSTATPSFYVPLPAIKTEDDEVDLILHPLKSELNFPIGDKFDLDGSDEGERWNLPIHLLDAIFYTQTGKVSTFENRGLAVDILKRLSNCVQQGVTARNLQMLPHSKSPHLLSLSLLFPHPDLFLLFASHSVE